MVHGCRAAMRQGPMGRVARALCETRPNRGTPMRGTPMRGTLMRADTSKDPVTRRLTAGLAQLVEHLICNQGVGGSSPSAGTSFERGLLSLVPPPGTPGSRGA